VPRTERFTYHAPLSKFSFVPLKEANRLRLERLSKRHAARRAQSDAVDARAAFDAAFADARARVLVPLLRDFGAELDRGGHRHVVEVDTDPREQSVVLRVHLKGAKAGNANFIILFVKHDETSGEGEVIVHLALNVEFELGRFTTLAEMSPAAVEQMVMDGLEHLIVCNQ
jgi:hypothetical protein